MYYGLIKPEHAVDIVDAIVGVLGGGEKAKQLMLETAMQESRLGMYRDRTDYGAGTGLCQADKFPFEDRQYRMQRKTKWLEAIEKEFDVKWMDVNWRELEHSPLLSFLDCRICYKLRPEPIPGSVAGRAAYWKQFYNTDLGS